MKDRDYIIKVERKIKEGAPDYDAIDEPFYYKVCIEGHVNGMFGYLCNTYDYYPPDPKDSLSQINLGALPSLYGRLGKLPSLGNEPYYDVLQKVKSTVDQWEFKQKLSPETQQTFGDLIDEL
jgi:hypothetical protein